MLRAAGVSFAYRRGSPVLSDVDLQLTPGRVTAIVGPNAAGKSTLLRLLAGLLRPGRGSVTLDDRPLHKLPPPARARRIALAPQRPAVSFEFTLRRVVGFGASVSGARPDTIASALERVELGHLADRPFATLSEGQRQRGALARALAQLDAMPDRDGRTLLADEPTSASDPRHALRTMALLRDLAADGVAVALVAHDLNLALRAADDALVLDSSGRPLASGPATETLSPETLAGAFDVRFLRVASKQPDLPAGLVPISTLDQPHEPS